MFAPILYCHESSRAERSRYTANDAELENKCSCSRLASWLLSPSQTQSYNEPESLNSIVGKQHVRRSNHLSLRSSVTNLQNFLQISPVSWIQHVANPSLTSVETIRQRNTIGSILTLHSYSVSGSHIFAITISVEMDSTVVSLIATQQEILTDCHKYWISSLSLHMTCRCYGGWT